MPVLHMTQSPRFERVKWQGRSADVSGGMKPGLAFTNLKFSVDMDSKGRIEVSNCSLSCIFTSCYGLLCGEVVGFAVTLRSNKLCCEVHTNLIARTHERTEKQYELQVH